MADVMVQTANGMDAHQAEPHELSPEEEFDAAFEEDDEQPEDTFVEPDVKDDEPPVEKGTDEPHEPAPMDVEEPEQHPAGIDDAAKGAEGDDQRYKSMMGRLKATQTENLSMKSELAALRARIEALTNAPAPAPAKQEEAVPVEGIEELAESVRPLFTEKSREGDVLRKMLEEYGPDHATVIAEAMLAKREARGVAEEMRHQSAVDADARHKMTLAQAHPEFADAILEKDAAKSAELMNGINAWIRVLPYAEGAEMMRVLQNGSTSDVSDMLAKYKQFRRGSGQKVAQPKPAGGSAGKIAQNNMVVPSRGNAVPPKEKATDFDSAWDEAPD